MGVERAVKPTVEVLAGTFHTHPEVSKANKLHGGERDVNFLKETFNSHSLKLALEALLAGGRSGARAAPRLGHGAPARMRLSIIRCKGCDFVHEPIVRALVR